MQTSAQESARQDEPGGLRWQTADPGQRRATGSKSPNGGKTPRQARQDDTRLSPAAPFDSEPESKIAAPVDDPFNDRGRPLSDGGDSNDLRSRSESARRTTPTRTPAANRRPQEQVQETPPAEPAPVVQEQLPDPVQDPVQDPLQDPLQGRITSKSCDEFRMGLINQPITTVDVNVAAPRPDLYRGVNGGERDWTDRFGHSLGRGRMVELRHGYVVIDTGAGTQAIPVATLGDADLAAVSQTWRVPMECTLGDTNLIARSWVAQTYTWKASNLCHKPLYFEDEQLERYGHSAGPILQPLKSTAHFFVQLAALPYQMGIHPPNECQYALGFYRPGNCAPWLCEPVPISLSGSLNQAAVMTGGAYLFP
jgi:hypothetical protein